MQVWSKKKQEWLNAEVLCRFNESKYEVGLAGGKQVTVPSSDRIRRRKEQKEEAARQAPPSLRPGIGECLEKITVAFSPRQAGSSTSLFQLESTVTLREPSDLVPDFVPGDVGVVVGIDEGPLYHVQPPKGGPIWFEEKDVKAVGVELARLDRCECNTEDGWLPGVIAETQLFDGEEMFLVRLDDGRQAAAPKSSLRPLDSSGAFYEVVVKSLEGLEDLHGFLAHRGVIEGDALYSIDGELLRTGDLLEALSRPTPYIATFKYPTDIFDRNYTPRPIVRKSEKKDTHVQTEVPVPTMDRLMTDVQLRVIPSDNYGLKPAAPTGLFGERSGTVDLLMSLRWKEEYREKLEKIYKEHNPAKLHMINDFMMRYQNHEDTLYRKVCRQYELEPEAPPVGYVEDYCVQAQIQAAKGLRVTEGMPGCSNGIGKLDYHTKVRIDFRSGERLHVHSRYSQQNSGWLKVDGWIDEYVKSNGRVQTKVLVVQVMKRLATEKSVCSAHNVAT